MADYDVIIIGSGIGGLTAGALLTKLGYRVLILEQHRIPGGYCSSFRRKGFDFDTGVHYLGNVEGDQGYIGRILKYLGLDKEITFIELDHDCFDKLIFPDFTFSVPKGIDRYRERLDAAFPGESQGIDEYFNVIEGIAKEIQRTPPRPKLKGRSLGPFKFAKTTKWLKKPLQYLLDKCTRNIQLKAVLASPFMAYGEPPATASILVHTMFLLQNLGGAYYPRGGTQHIPTSIARYIVSHGGEIRYHSPVARILIDSNKAIGIKIENKEEILGSHIISNADTWETFYKLVGEKNFPEKWFGKIGKYTPSISSFSVFLGLKTNLKKKGISASNYLLFGNYDFNEVFRKLDTEVLSEGFPLFVTSPTVKDDSGELSPAGCHILQMITPVQFKHFARWKDQSVMHRDPEYKELKSAIAHRIIDRVEQLVPDIRKYIEVMEIGTPLTQLSYICAREGANFGFRKIPEQTGQNAIPAQTPIENLYLTGANIVGHGVANVMLSGVYCTDLISKKRLLNKIYRNE
jgi:all-trans-retinol 13,14-reductase